MYVPDNHDVFLDYERERERDESLNEKITHLETELEDIRDILAMADGEEDKQSYIEKAIERIDIVLN